jgi:hypothetical protein
VVRRNTSRHSIRLPKYSGSGFNPAATRFRFFAIAPVGSSQLFQRSQLLALIPSLAAIRKAKWQRCADSPSAGSPARNSAHRLRRHSHSKLESPCNTGSPRVTSAAGAADSFAPALTKLAKPGSLFATHSLRFFLAALLKFDASSLNSTLTQLFFNCPALLHWYDWY